MMETKANTALIGAFTLLVLALGFGFIYWLARADGSTEAQPLKIVFTGPVSGLSSGSQVLFNGIRVGDVQRLTIDPQDPRRVIADLRVDAATPIKTDTSASVGFQGLTGVAYVELIGGSPEAPGVWEAAEGEVAVLIGERSAVQDLMSGARQLMGRADETLTAIQGLVSDNSEAVNRSVANLETFTAALSENADQISTFVRSVSEAAEGITRLSGRLEEVVSRGETLIAAVEPDKVRQTVDNVTLFSETLAASRDDIDALVTRLSTISADVGGFTARLQTIGEKADLLVTDLGDRTGRLMDALDSDAIQRTIANLDRITGAVEPEKVQRAIDNIERVTGAVEPDSVRIAIANLTDFSETLSARREDIDALVTRLSAISADVSGFTADLPALRQRVDAVVAAVDPEKVARAVDNIDRVAASVPPEAVQSAVTNFADFSQTLSARREDIDALVTRLSAISADVSGFTARLPAMGERVDAVVAAVDPEKVARAVDNIDRVAASVPPEAVTSAVTNISQLAETLAARRGDIDILVTRLSAISSDVRTFAEGLPALRERVDAVAAAVDPQKVSRAIDNIDRVAASVPPEAVASAVTNIAAFSQTLSARREDVDALVTRLSTISNDVSGFTTRLPGMGERFDTLLGAVDAAKVGESVDGVHQFATALANSSGDVEAIVADVRSAAERFNGLSERAESLIANLDEMTGEGTEGLFAEVRQTLEAIRVAADNFSTQAESISGGINQFTSRGLREMQDFVAQGRRAASRLERVLSDMERDPGQFLLGGEGVPEYSGGRRR